jgi:hypothetical protein
MPMSSAQLAELVERAKHKAPPVVSPPPPPTPHDRQAALPSEVAAPATCW